MTAQRVHRRRRVALWITGALVTVLVAGGIVAVTTAARTADTVATVDGHSVTRDELLFHMKRLVPTVQNALQVETGHTGSAIGWDENINGTSALTRLREAALAEITTDKSLMVLAQDEGLIDSVDFDSLDAARATENTARAASVARGETVFGLTEFTMEEFYAHTLAELRTRLLEVLSDGDEETLTVTPGEVEAYFTAHREDWQANATTYTYSVLVAPEAAAAAVDETVDAGGNLAAAASTIPQSTITHATLGGDVPIGPGGHDQDILLELGVLEAGGISAPVAVDGQLTYYQLDAVSINDDTALQNYSSRIEQTLLEERFDALLAERIHQNVVTENGPVLHSITPEELTQ